MEQTDKLSMSQRREMGLLWVDHGENMQQQVYARGLCQDFNHTKPDEVETRTKLQSGKMC